MVHVGKYQIKLDNEISIDSYLEKHLINIHIVDHGP